MEQSNQLFNTTFRSEILSCYQSSKYSRWNDYKQESHTNQLTQFCAQLDPPTSKKKSRSVVKRRIPSLQPDKINSHILPRLQKPNNPLIKVNSIEVDTSNPYSPRFEARNCRSRNRSDTHRVSLTINPKSELPQLNLNQHRINNIEDFKVSIRVPNQVMPHHQIKSNSPSKKLRSYSINHSRQFLPNSIQIKTQEQISFESQIIRELISPKVKTLQQSTLKNRDLLQQQYSEIHRGQYRNQDYYLKYKDQKLFLQMSSKISRNLSINMSIF